MESYLTQVVFFKGLLEIPGQKFKLHAIPHLVDTDIAFILVAVAVAAQSAVLISKDRVSIRLLPPMTEEQKKAAAERNKSVNNKAE